MLQLWEGTVCDALDQMHELALLFFEFSEFHLDTSGERLLSAKTIIPVANELSRTRRGTRRVAHGGSHDTLE